MCVRKVDGWARAHAAHHCGEQLLSGVLFGVGVRDTGDLSTDSRLTLEEFSLKHLHFGSLLFHPRASNKTYLKMRLAGYDRWSLRFPVHCERRFRLDQNSFLCCCWYRFSRIWHTSGPDKRIFTASDASAAGGDQWRDRETCLVQDTVSLFESALPQLSQRESHGVLAHADARLDRHLRGGESSEWHGADRPRGQMPRGLRL